MATEPPTSPRPYDRTVRSVFLDTCIYYSFGFNPSSGSLQALERLCRSSDIKLLTTDILMGEVAAGVEEAVDEALKIINSKRSKLRILDFDHKKYLNIQDDIDSKSATNSAMIAINGYWNRCNYRNISVQNLDTGKLVESYFSGNPPFGAKRKKSEFPDAINLQCIENYAKANSTKVYFITTDGDFLNRKSESEYVIFDSNIDDFVAYFAKDALTEEVADFLEGTEVEIFESAWDSVSDHFVEIDAHEFDIYDSAVDDFNLYHTRILSIEDGNVIARLEYAVNLSLRFDYRPIAEHPEDADETGYSLNRRHARVRKSFTLKVDFFGKWDHELKSMSHVAIKPVEPQSLFISSREY